MVILKGAENMTAIYARQSVDRADSISIEQQIGLCRYEARGEEVVTYIDRGYSGRNTNRPEFRRMMDDIREGHINTVIVYKLDRISRSILDFSKMMEVFGERGVQFISATEKFDTSSPMGNAMLNICIVFAQLERETIQKRVADAYFSRSQRRFYMGGPIPYGFRKIPTVIDGIHTSMYEAVSEEADVVRMIFEMYSERDTSLGEIAVRLNDLGIKKRGKPWVRQRLREMIINPIYVMADGDVYDFFNDNGADMVDAKTAYIGENGCYSYRRCTDGNKKTTDGIQIVLAPHKGIVSSELWLKCRRKCSGRNAAIPSQKARNSWLSGKIKCGECGYALTAKEYDGGRRRYLRCSNRQNSGSCKGAGTLYTAQTEELVFNEICVKITELFCTEKAAQDAERLRLENELWENEREIEGLVDRVNGADDAVFRYISDRINTLDLHGKDLIQRINRMANEGGAGFDEKAPDMTLWNELSFEDKRQVVDTLISAVYAYEGHIIIQWRI